MEEFTGQVSRPAGLDVLALKVELKPGTDTMRLKGEIENELRRCLGLRIDVELVPPRTLPRYEVKAKRFTRV